MNLFKKIVLVSFLIIIIVVFCTVTCFAENVSINIEDFGGAEVYNELPEEIQRMFEDLGIDSLNFDSLFNVSAEDVFNLTKKLLTGVFESPFESAIRLAAVIIIVSIFSCFFPDDIKFISILQIVGILLCVSSIVKPITTVISSAAASVEIMKNFMLVLIPILTAVVSVSGNPSLAASFQSVAFVGAQILSAFVSNVVIPFVGTVLALDITGSLIPKFKFSALTSMIKKAITAVLSFSSTLYVSFLSLKAGLANSADTMLGKGIKLVISSAVPVVGGALSEAYSGVMGSLVLVKSTIGVFGICAVALVMLPSCIQLLFWIFALKISAGIADLFEQTAISALLKSIGSSLVLLNVIIVFVAVLFIISTAIILVIKSR